MANLDNYISEVNSLESSKLYQQRMNAITMAALGLLDKSDSIHKDYVTPELKDVFELREKYAELRKRYLGY